MLAFAFVLACSPQTGDPVQETPPSDWSDVDRAVAELVELQDLSEPAVRIGGFVAIAGLYSNTSDIQSPDKLGGFSLNAARLWVDGNYEGWNVHIEVRGEQYSDPIPETTPGARLLGVAGVASTLRPEEMYIGRELIEDALDLRVGRFHVPLLSSGLYEANRLLFDHRTFNGEVIAFPRTLDTGVELQGQLGPFRAWAAAQNGHDDAGSDLAYTARVLWDVFGIPAALENEGAYGAPEEPALTIGGAAYYDSTDNDFSTQALEGMFTLKRLSLQAEIVDYGDGVGQELYSWGATASFLITETIEVAARYESADRDDGPYIKRLGVNKYFIGHDVKMQAVYTSADSNARLIDVDLFSLGLVVSI